FGQGKPGWGFHWGLNWFGAGLDRSIGNARVELAQLNVRPFMAGYGYTYKIRRYTISGVALGGYAFTSIDLSDPAVAAYSQAGITGVDVDVSNTFTFRPEVGVWYD